MPFRVSFNLSLGFHLWFLQVNLWFLQGSFSVSCRGFLSGVLVRNSLGFLQVSPRVVQVLFRIQTGENKAKELGFHLGILWDSLAFRVSLRFTSLQGFIWGFFGVSVGFHVGFDLGILQGFIQGFVTGFLSGILIKILNRSCGFLQGFFNVSFRVSFRVSLGFIKGFIQGFFRVPFRVSFRVSFMFLQGVIQGFFGVSFTVSLVSHFRVSFTGSSGFKFGFHLGFQSEFFRVSLGFSFRFHLGFHSIFRQGFIYCFRLIYGFFRVHLAFHVGVSCQEFLSGILQGFFRFHLGSLGFHSGFLQGFMQGLIQGYFRESFRV